MGFKMKKIKGGFAPMISCDVCGEFFEAKMLNFEHSWDCERSRIVCKDHSRVNKQLYDGWMEMNEYIYYVGKNTKVDFKRAKKINEFLGL